MAHWSGRPWWCPGQDQSGGIQPFSSSPASASLASPSPALGEQWAHPCQSSRVSRLGQAPVHSWGSGSCAQGSSLSLWHPGHLSFYRVWNVPANSCGQQTTPPRRLGRLWPQMDPSSGLALRKPGTCWAQVIGPASPYRVQPSKMKARLPAFPWSLPSPTAGTQLPFWGLSILYP